MPVISHIHTYIRKKNRPDFYQCNAPDCSHFIDKASIQGKFSLCSECGSQFVLSREDLRRARPRCIQCSNTKKARDFKKAQELTRYIGTDIYGNLAIEPLAALALERQETNEFSDFSDMEETEPEG